MKYNLVMPYFNNGKMLERHFDEWASYPQDVKDRLRITIVDDGSARDPALPHFRNIGIETRLYRILVDKPWNWDGARNLGLHEIPSEPVLHTDMDHLLPVASAKRLVEMKVKEGRYYVPARIRAVDGQPHHRHPNSWIMQRDLHWRAGGYDERFSGLYGKDAVYRRALEKVARRSEIDEVTLVLFGREVIEDASTTEYSRKEGEYYTKNRPEVRAMLYDGKRPTEWLLFPWERLI